MSTLRAIAVACGSCGFFVALASAEPAPPPEYARDSWRAVVAYHDPPACQLYSTGVGDKQKGLVLVPHWTARDGWALWFLTHNKDMMTVRFESPGTADAWDITLEPAREDYHGRRAFLAPAISDSMLHSLEKGQALSISVTYESGPPLQATFNMDSARYAAPMYRACVKSLTDDPPRYWRAPSAGFHAIADPVDRCDFLHYIEFGYFSVSVALRADKDGAEVIIGRATESGGHHERYRRREVPDHVDARQLFGPEVDLVDSFRYRITLQQLNELTGALVRGETRALAFTEKSGKKSDVEFGGRWGKPTAAMFAACRKVKFSEAGG